VKHLVLVAKSPWSPAIRREHALAAQACSNGVRVDFIESPSDIRRLGRPDRGGWFGGLRAAEPGRPVAGVTAHPRSTIVPGHRSSLAATVDNRLLRRSVRALCRASDSADVAIVVNVPWQWDATANIGVRRVFDAADDWNLLLSGRRPHLRRLYAQIGAEADAVIVANENLSPLFAGRLVHHIPNGTPAHLVAEPVTRPRDARRMIYVGTFSERFDVDLVAHVLMRLPDWTLDLVGECRYAGHGARPERRLADLIAGFDDRVSWHGGVPRTELGRLLDGTSVALVPHRAQYCRGQSSMKFLDYAARGCPVVSTRWDEAIDRQAPPGVWFADTVDDFAAAVLLASRIDDDTAARSVAWARTQTWDRLWPAWAGAVFGGQPWRATDRKRGSSA
jgi:glycosyltransferase involved in cell wall biosynthesis